MAKRDGHRKRVAAPSAERALYKYVTHNTGKLVLEGGRLRWSRPHLLNDPFDVQFDPRLFPLAFERLKEQAAGFLWEAACNRRQLSQENKWAWAVRACQLEGMSRTEALNWFTGLIDSVGKFVVMAGLPDAHEQIRAFFANNVRILCLSAVSDSVPMWSYYAEAHAGLALKFRAIDDTHSLVRNAKPIIYQAKVPPILSEQKTLEIFIGKREMGFEPSELIGQLILTKAQNWQHEREYRIVEFSAGSDRMPHKDWPFEPDELEAIILGCKMRESARQEIIDIAKRKYPQARILEARPSSRSFKLQIGSVPATNG